MTEENSKLAENLNQIRLDWEKQLSGIESLKETADAALIGDIEKIERDGWQAVMDISELQKKIAAEQRDNLES